MKAPHIKTALPGPKAKAIVERDRQVTAPAYGRVYPLVVKQAQGMTVEDVDGNLFLDFMAGIAVASTGHSHPRVVKAIEEQARKFLHICGSDYYFEAMVELAETLSRLAPGVGSKKVFFTNSGTEAVEAAIKLARHHTKRQHIIAFYGAFHGRTLGALSLTASRASHRAYFGPLIPGVHHVPSGFCRNGKMFASEHWGIEPDILCVAKGIASGMPLGAMIARAEVSTWTPGTHGSTLGGNPVACAAALATIELLEEGLVENAAQVGARLKDQLTALQTRHAAIGEVRGLGLMIGVDFEHSDDSHAPDGKLRDRVMQKCV